MGKTEFEKKIDKLNKVLFSNKIHPKELTILFVTKREYLRVYNGLHSVGTTREDYGLIKNLKLERGKRKESSYFCARYSYLCG